MPNEVLPAPELGNRHRAIRVQWGKTLDAPWITDAYAPPGRVLLPLDPRHPEPEQPLIASGAASIKKMIVEVDDRTDAEWLRVLRSAETRLRVDLTSADGPTREVLLEGPLVGESGGGFHEAIFEIATGDRIAFRLESPEKVYFDSRGRALVLLLSERPLEAPVLPAWLRARKDR